MKLPLGEAQPAPSLPGHCRPRALHIQGGQGVGRGQEPVTAGAGWPAGLTRSFRRDYQATEFPLGMAGLGGPLPSKSWGCRAPVPENRMSSAVPNFLLQ